MIANGQMKSARETHPSTADQFYDLATYAVLRISITFAPRALLVLRQSRFPQPPSARGKTQVTRSIKG